MHNRTNEDSTRRRCNTHTHGVSNHSKEEPPKTRVSDQRKEQRQTKSPTTEKNHGDSKQQSTTNPNGWTSRTPVKGRVTTSLKWDGWVSVVYDSHKSNGVLHLSQGLRHTKTNDQCTRCLLSVSGTHIFVVYRSRASQTDCQLLAQNDYYY